MKENKMLTILQETMEQICDHICFYARTTPKQEKLDEICAECTIGDHLIKISNEYDKYFKIARCQGCEYYREDIDCQGTDFTYCRNDSGLDEHITKDDGCSRGRRKH